MSIDPKFGRYCDGCGRGITTAVRIHLGKDYCRSCYTSNFTRVPCPECQQPMRRHRHAPDDTACKTCVRSKRTCLRCGKFTPVAAKLVGQSAVCGACAVHFREERPCTSCGKPSKRLSRALFTGLQEEICDSCRDRLTHATCTACRRYRRVANTEQGKPICRACLSPQPAVHDCPECGASVAGSGVARCRPCVIQSSVSAEAAMAAAELEGEAARSLWQGFVATQLADRTDNPKRVKQVAHAVGFFRLLDQAFKKVTDIDTTSMMQKIDGRELRRYLIASTYVIQTLRLDLAQERDRATEARRTKAIIDRANAKKGDAGSTLRSYAVWLVAQDVAPRTARMYLRAAESFGHHVTLSDPGWAQEQLIRYLKKSPGNRASLTRFVSYCRKVLGWDVKMVSEAAIATATGPRSPITRQVEQLRKAIAVASKMEENTMPTKTVARILSLALDLPTAVLLRARNAGDVVVREDGTIEVAADAALKPSDTLYPYARRWAALGRRYRQQKRLADMNGGK